MESTKQTFIEWIDISNKVDNNEELNPIDKFLYDNSPAGIEEEEKFRRQLLNAINYEDDETKTHRNSELVSAFIEHCKENGLIIKDELFESFFNA